MAAGCEAEDLTGTFLVAWTPEAEEADFFGLAGVAATAFRGVGVTAGAVSSASPLSKRMVTRSVMVRIRWLLSSASPFIIPSETFFGT